ncbi:hypothetical protein FPV67DRAFT_1779222 [Lyophyllum atratum]|nr:hypothetical protein FPV67DRAFT_1779222 [Lyophyllum atratum]
MTGFFVGPMPVEQFLEDFLPPPNDPRPVLPTTFFDDMGEKFRLESDMCKAFEEYVPSNLIPGFKIVNTSNHRDRDSETKLRPDPTLYRADLNTDDKKTQYSEIELHFELKANTLYDPFEDPKEGADILKHNFESTKIKRTDCRGQLLSYATEWFSRQHRCFGFYRFHGRSLYTLYSMGSCRRHCIGQVQLSGGLQTAHGVSLALLPSYTRSAWLGSDSAPRASRGGQFGPREALAVEARSLPGCRGFSMPVGDTKREFIAWGAMAYPESLTGRCTRAYPVFEEKTGLLGFLKDSWRAEDLEKESAILRTLQEARVEHIPGFVCGDDLPDQTTVTDIYVPRRASGTAPSEASSTSSDGSSSGSDVSEEDVPLTERRITRRYHHRMITNVIGHHLKKFTSSKQMMQVVSHAFTAHQQAYERCEVIHRDISAYNILIKNNGEGILNDWDLAKYKKDIVANRPRRHERTGTWQFMSCLLLMNRHKPHTIQDDIESFVHLILYHSIRYLRHTKSREVGTILSRIFDDVYHKPDGSQVGGMNKKYLFKDKGEFLPFEGFRLRNNVPLNTWIYDALHAVDEWITKVGQKGVITNLEALKGLRLYDHHYMANQFANCLQQQGWPSGDKAVDYLPAVAHGSTSSQTGSTGSSRGSGSKRGLTTEDDEEYVDSRSKAKKQKGSVSNSGRVLRSSRRGGSAA